ncbi:hypothetical protein [Actinomadura rudentiformis]|uniref:Uncharacterized protein n=1 Tax=Actinomadura rudentiformis TaxID=359158 RepID=A0A6H9YTY9_9ACTN|nr:hypothetical protein [Actinomadura rudentiformis]KAB2347823.1 hypothetical protein F8566_18190 [Actinomadura rudentiformis]
MGLDIDPKVIADHAKDLEADVKPKVKQAGDALGKDGVFNLEGGDFSITCTMAAMAYPGGVQFAFEDLKTHLGMLEDFITNVNATAQRYAAAEHNNTL